MFNYQGLTRMEVHPHEPLKQARTLINSLTLTWDALFDRNAKFLLTLTYKKKAPQSKEGGMTTGQCLSVGKQLLVYPLTF
jgi:hypothetical protein